MLYRVSFVGIFAAYLFLAASYSLVAPTFEGPDEQKHMRYVYGVKSWNLSKSLYLQYPPLYYSILAGASFLLPHVDYQHLRSNRNYPYEINRFRKVEGERFPFSGFPRVVHGLRVFSITFGFFTLFFVRRIGQIIFSEDKNLQLLMLSLVAFLPKFVWINSVVNPDSLLYLLCTASFYFLLRSSSNNPRKQDLYLFSLTAGLAMLTKASALIVYAVFVLFLLFSVLRKQILLKDAANKLLIFLFISLPAGGWYLVHKILIATFPEELHYRSVFRLLTQAQVASTDKPAQMSELSSVYLDWGFLRGRVFDMNWSMLGWHSVNLNPSLNTVNFWLLVFGMLGALFFFLRGKGQSICSFSKDHSFILIASGLVSLLCYLSYFAVSKSGDIRYAYPAIFSYAAFLAAGFYGIASSIKMKFLCFLLPLILFASNLSLLSVMKGGY